MSLIFIAKFNLPLQIAIGIHIFWGFCGSGSAFTMTAFAYLADVTPLAHRTKSFGSFEAM